MKKRAGKKTAMAKAGGGVDTGTLRKACSELISMASGGMPSGGAAIPSRSALDDPFEGRKIDGVIEPRKPPLYWCLLARSSSVLPAVIRALEIGVESYGYEFVPLLAKDGGKWYAKEDAQKDDVWAMIQGEGAERPTDRSFKDMDELLAVELERLERFYDNFSPFDSFTTIRGRFRTDEETTGWWTMEVLRDALGIPCGGEHVPSYQTRMLVRDDRPTDMTQARIGHDWRWVLEERPHYFRLFVQIKGNRKHYYKQFMDPRNFSYLTGKLIGSPDATTAATEMIYCGKYVPGSEYGEPDWASQEYNIGGAFQAERGNFRHFRNNLIPAILLLIMGGGTIGEDALKRMLDTFENVPGDDSASRLFAAQIPSGIAEAATSGGKIDSPKVLLQILTHQQKQDSTFQQYIQNCAKMTMGSTRVPPILVGWSNDYNKATSQAALEMFEAQVCRPKRNKFDDLQNRVLLPEMRVRFHEFRSNGPDLMDIDTVASMLTSVAGAGGMSINGAIELGNKFLGTNVPAYPGEEGNMPMTLLLQKLQAEAFPIGGMGFTKDNAGKAAVAVTDLVMDALLHIRRSMGGKLEG